MRDIVSIKPLPKAPGLIAYECPSCNCRTTVILPPARGARARATSRHTHIERPIGEPAMDEAEYFIRCPICGGWIDCRDLDQVFELKSRNPNSVVKLKDLQTGEEIVIAFKSAQR
jgi:hypothetical protein